MAFKRTLLILIIVLLGTNVDDTHGNEVVNLGKDSFYKDVAVMPHFVRFCVPW